MSFDIFWMNVAAVFALSNVVLVVLLGAVYFQSWRRIRSSITASLILFAFFFLVQNIVVIVFWYNLYGFVPEAQSTVEWAAPYLVLVNLFETVALGNLVRISWR